MPDKTETGPKILPSHPLGYGVALASVGLALGLKLLLDPLTVQDTPFLLTFGAIMVSAWYGGLGPGLLATVLAALIADYFFLHPKGSFSGLSPQAAPLVAFLLEGGLVSFLASSLRSATARAEASAQEARAHEDSLRTSEERFRMLVEGVKDYAILMLSPEGRVESWNEGAERIEGYRAEEVLGRHFSVFYTEEDVERSHPEGELRVATSEGRYEEEGVRVRKDGSRFWASVLITALRDEDGNLRGFSKVVRDVSERKRAEAELRSSLDSLLAIHEAGQILGSTLERDEIVSKLLEITQRIYNLSAACIDLLRGEDQRLSTLRAVGSEDLWRRARSAPEAEAARRAVLEAARPRSFELPPGGANGARLVGLCLPLRVRNRVIGLLEAYGPEALAEDGNVETLASIANQGASALENARLYEELAERERELQDLVGRMLVAQDEERRRVAYEVHDGLTQMVVAAHQRLQMFAEDHPPGSAEGREELEELTELVRRTVGEARRVIADLRPTTLDDFGLATAVRLQVEEMRASGYEASYEEALGEERLPAALETALFRVVQEALTNVRKHAGTDRIRVELGRRDGTIRLEVGDWGRGFRAREVASGGGPGERVGLSSMRERVALLGGDLEIRSEPGEGTSVVAQIPLSVMEEAEHGG